MAVEETTMKNKLIEFIQSLTNEECQIIVSFLHSERLCGDKEKEQP